MYKLIVWDTVLAGADRSGALAELMIPKSLAGQLFGLDSTAFPLLSGLSFDDYDLFSDAELDMLAAELRAFEGSKPEFIGVVKEMKSAIAMAQATGKAVLFDPFQRE